MPLLQYTRNRFSNHMLFSKWILFGTIFVWWKRSTRASNELRNRVKKSQSKLGQFSIHIEYERITQEEFVEFERMHPIFLFDEYKGIILNIAKETKTDKNTSSSSSSFQAFKFQSQTNTRVFPKMNKPRTKRDRKTSSPLNGSKFQSITLSFVPKAL